MTVDPLDHDHPDDPHPTGEERERFRVTDDRQAEWAMRKLAKHRSRVAEIESITDAEVERVRLWRDSQLAGVEPDIAYFEGLLTEYARGQREEGRKSISLPHGVIKSRAGGRRIDVDDAAVFIAWAEQNSPTLIRVRTEPDKVAIKALMSDEGDSVVDLVTGEVVPGVSITQSETTYTIETN